MITCLVRTGSQPTRPSSAEVAKQPYLCLWLMGGLPATLATYQRIRAYDMCQHDQTYNCMNMLI